MRKIGFYHILAAAAFLTGCGSIQKASTPPVQPGKLTISTTSLPSGTVGVAYSGAITATGGTTPYTYSATGLPSSLSINSSTGVISGTPALSAVGSHSVNVTVTDAGKPTAQSATAVLSITVSAALTAQTITFANPGSQAVGTPLTLSATASSGLTVSFTSTTTSVCTVSGTTTTFIAAGTCSITASQAGNATYAAATSVSRSFTVNAVGNPTITSFTASPTSIASGSSSSLSWATTGATSIAITPGTFTSTSASGSTTVSPTATTTYTLTATNAVGSVTATAKVTVATPGGTLTITTATCPGGTQGTAYAGCTIVASGGTPPYTYSLSTDVIDFPPLPEGMSLNAATGQITSSLIGGQGTYIPEIVVTDSTSAQATKDISFAINGSNAFLAKIFPSNSIFHHRVDAATTGLPVDTSPAAPMYSGYLSATVKPFFGDQYANFPNGIPAIEVPYNQPDVSVSTTVYQSYFTSGPIPAYAPPEGTANSNGDRHVLVYLDAGGGNKPALYEMWQGIYVEVPGRTRRMRFGPTYLRTP